MAQPLHPATGFIAALIAVPVVAGATDGTFEIAGVEVDEGTLVVTLVGLDDAISIEIGGAKVKSPRLAGCRHPAFLEG